MQDRYAGDIGDYGKIALLRVMQAQDFSVGVNWYKVEELDSEKNSDGSYKQDDGKYLIPETLRVCDPALAETLTKIAQSKRRSIDAIQKADLIPEALYYKRPVTVEGRVEWHQTSMKKLAGANLIFMDPDNGLKVKSVGKRSAKSVKYVFYDEVKDYIGVGKSVLVYNHRCRKPEKQYFEDIECRIQEEVGISRSDIREITFSKGTTRDYFAIPANKDHADMFKAAFEDMANGIWGQRGICRLRYKE